jgi:hypothetical protein
MLLPDQNENSGKQREDAHDHAPDRKHAKRHQAGKNQKDCQENHPDIFGEVHGPSIGGVNKDDNGIIGKCLVGVEFPAAFPNLVAAPALSSTR